MTHSYPLYLLATGAPAACAGALTAALIGQHRADSLTPAPEPQPSRRRSGAHRKHVRYGETAVCPVPNDYANPARSLRKPRAPGAHRLIAWLRSHVDLSAVVYLQRDHMSDVSPWVARRV